MSGVGIIPCCCGNFNVCSFESDGTLRWRRYWSAIDPAAGGMTLFETATEANYWQIGLFAVGSYLLALGVKSGKYYVASLSLSDGSDYLPATDTGIATNIFATYFPQQGHRYYQDNASEVIVGGMAGTTSPYLRRIAVNASGSVTDTSSGTFNGSAFFSALTPAGQLVGIGGYVDGSGTHVESKSIDGSGSTGTNDTLVKSVTAPFCRGSEAAYMRRIDVGDGTPDQYIAKSAIPISGGPGALTAYGDDTYTQPGMTLHSLSAADADHLWLHGRNSGTNVAIYYDLAGQVVDWTVPYSSTNQTSGRDFHVGPGDILYAVNRPTASAIHICAINSGGSVSVESAAIANDLYGGSTYAHGARVFSDASGHVTVGWPTGSAGQFNVARFTRSGADLDIEWQWEGVPGLAKTVDSNGYLYCAQADSDGILGTSAMNRVV